MRPACGLSHIATTNHNLAALATFILSRWDTFIHDGIHTFLFQPFYNAHHNGSCLRRRAINLILILRFALQIHFLFSILSCILYFCIFFFHPGSTSHGSPIHTNPFGVHYLILLLLIIIVIVFSLHICNLMVTKPNKV